RGHRRGGRPYRPARGQGFRADRRRDRAATVPTELTHHSVRAAARAASGPSARRTSKPASSRIGTPSDCAFSNLDPGLSPTTTKSVFFDTEPVTLPPRTLTASPAPSREGLASGTGDTPA